MQNEGEKLNLNGVFSFDIDEKTKETHLDKSIKRQEKLEKLMENPELSDLPPRYMDMLL